MAPQKAPSASARPSGGTFNVDPLGADWLTLDGNLKLTSGVELDFADIITFVGEERVLATKELFHLDSNEPLANDQIQFDLQPDGSDLFAFQPLLDLEEPAQFYRINFDLLNVATPSSREKTE